jgi:hypothetical protein
VGWTAVDGGRQRDKIHASVMNDGALVCRANVRSPVEVVAVQARNEPGRATGDVSAGRPVLHAAEQAGQLRFEDAPTHVTPRLVPRQEGALLVGDSATAARAVVDRRLGLSAMELGANEGRHFRLPLGQ